MNQLLKKTPSVFRQGIAIMLAMVIVISTLTFGLNAMINKIKIIDTSFFKVIYTLSSSPSSILANAGIKLDSDDTYSMNWLNGREGELILKRAVEVTVSYNDDKVTVSIPQGTVKEAIDEAGFTLTDDMVLNCSVNSTVTEGMEIEIYDVITETVYEDEEIPFETVKEKSSKLAKGTEKVAVEGKNGTKRYTYTRTVINGETVSKELTGEEIVEKPTNRKILVGTKTTTISATKPSPTTKPSTNTKPSTTTPSTSTDKVENNGTTETDKNTSTESAPESSETETKTVYYTKAGYKYVSSLKPSKDFLLDENGIPVNYSKKITGKATAYSYDAGSLTATGKKVRTGYVAVNPKQIPYGTKLFIRSTDGKYVYGYASAEDTGGFVKKGKITVDLFFPSTSACYKFGVRNVEIYVLN